MNKGHKIFYYSSLITIFIIIPVISGFISLKEGKDINWDLRNYHFYNGYAFLENRLGFDIAPAQIQTYFNPLLDVVTYLLYINLPSRAVGFLYGFIHGLNISMIGLIFLHITKIPSKIIKVILGVGVVCVSAVSPGFLSELGGSMSDNIISLLVLITLFIILISTDNLNNKPAKSGYIQLAVAGLVMGITVGFKLTSAIFAVSLGIFLPLLLINKIDKIRAFALFATVGMLGFVSSMGFWMAILWQKYGSPLFPFYNSIFHSPYYKPQSFLDQRFLPRNLVEYLSWPIVTSLNSLRVSEIKFSDIRFAMLYIVLIIWGILLVINRIKKSEARFLPTSSNALFNNKAGNYILAVFISSYIFWMIQFSIYRYIILLELLVPLCFLLVVDRIFTNKHLLYLAFLSSIIIGGFFFTPYNWIRIPWSDSYVQVDTNHISELHNADIVMLGTSPIAYVIPYFPKDDRFLRPESNFLVDYQTGLNQQIFSILDNTTNPIYILYDASDSSINLQQSAINLGINITSNNCQDISDNMPEELRLCLVTKD